MSSHAVRAATSTAIVLALWSAGTGGQLPRPIAATEGFDAYARGEFDRVVDSIKRISDLASFVRDLRRQSQGWIEAVGPEQAPRRRLIVASVALEAALAMPPRDADAAMAVELVQWACELVRRNPERTEAEYLWHRSALATIQRILLPGMPREWRDPVGQILRAHIGHGESRFPDNPAWKLAGVVSLELRTWYLNPTTARASCDNSKQAIRGYETLLTEEAVRAEAHLRTGYLKFRCEDAGSDASLPHLQHVEQSTDDPLLLYLAAFVRGQILEHNNALDRAAESYEAALNRWPGAQSAAIALAAIRFRQDRRQAALALAELSVQATPRDDPWRHYGRGDYRLQELMTRLRKAIS